MTKDFKKAAYAIVENADDVWKGKDAKRHRDQFSEALQEWDKRAPSANVEEFYILAELMARIDPPAWTRIVEALKYLIAKTIQLSVRQNRNHSPEHVSLVNQIFNVHFGGHTRGNPAPAVISLNWDILLDNALERHGRLGLDYMVPTNTERNRSPPNHRLRLLKLHGSLNWWRCNEHGLHVTQLSKSGQLEGENEPLQCQGCNKMMQAVIVPPTSQKLQINGAHDLEILWAKAQGLLGDCRELFFVGYSFPPADIQFRMLVMAGLQTNRNLTKIVVISNHKYGTERVSFEDSYAQIFRETRFANSLEFWYDGFENWVKAKPLLRQRWFGGVAKSKKSRVTE